MRLPLFAALLGALALPQAVHAKAPVLPMSETELAAPEMPPLLSMRERAEVIDAVLAEPADGLGRPVTTAAQVAPGAVLDAHLHDGRLRMEVLSVSEETALQAAQTPVEEP